MHGLSTQRLSLIAIACTLMACKPPESPAPTATSAAPPAPLATPADPKPDTGAGVTALTIYSGDYDALAQIERPGTDMPGYALVEQPLHYALKAGPNTIATTRVAPAMDVEAALLRAHTSGIVIEGQRYLPAPSGSQDVLATAIGRKIAVEHTSGNAKQTDSGVLLAADGGLTLALADGRTKLIREYDSFSMVDGDDALPRQAALQWTVRAQRAGDAAFVLAYPMGGMAWRAEYLATLAKGDACQLALDGAALVSNRAGITFDAAKLTLVAGAPNRVRRARDGFAAGNHSYAGDAAQTAAPVPVERSSGEYHAYELPRATRVAQGSTERVPLFAPRPTIACERAYVVDADIPQWLPPQPVLEPSFRGQTGALPVNATVSLANTASAGLGQPLPAGRVRVFDGSDFLGESALEHTAQGAEIRLEVGKAFDLGAQRENTAFHIDRAGRTVTESFAIKLSNAKPTPVTVRVIEPLPRWSDWQVTASSVPATKKDARHAQFDVAVPAAGETTLTYTVRYRWAKDLKP
ncbi:DUF4139 domain-containing protein [Lysobacter koreensis]|uniref:DUF4139 domain-containing protein n=1 Tax=Lysobacter koreensis TaxID=266122 RepID=A0ABW2YHV2_9GAMM